MQTTTRRERASGPPVSFLDAVRWLGRVLTAFADQGLFSASNFLLNIVLARWLSPSEYGAFAVTYSILILLGNGHTAILAEPMLVYGSNKYSRQFSTYFGLLLCGHWGIVGGTSLALALASFVLWRFGATILAHTLVGLALALPAILLFGLVRRAFYVRLMPQWAAAGVALYFPILIASIYILSVVHWLFSATALVVMGIVSLGVGLSLATRLLPSREFWLYPIAALKQVRRSLHSHLKNGPPEWGARHRSEESVLGGLCCAVVRDHWRYARWALGTTALGWLSSNLHYLVLGSASGLEQVGAMRALDTVLMPYWLYLSAISQLALPMLANASRTSPTALRSVALRTVGLLLAQGVIAYLVVATVGPRLIPLLYGTTYARLSYLLPQYSLILILETGSTAIALVFRSLTRTEMDFVYHILLSAGILLGFALTGKYDVSGLISIRIFVSFGLLLIFALVALRTLTSSNNLGVNREC